MSTNHNGQAWLVDYYLSYLSAKWYLKDPQKCEYTPGPICPRRASIHWIGICIIGIEIIPNRIGSAGKIWRGGELT